MPLSLYHKSESCQTCSKWRKSFCSLRRLKRRSGALSYLYIIVPSCANNVISILVDVLFIWLEISLLNSKVSGLEKKSFEWMRIRSWDWGDLKLFQ